MDKIIEVLIGCSGEIITASVTLLIAYIKKKIDLKKLKQSGKLKD